MDYAKLEAKMFRRLEIKESMRRLKEEAEAIEGTIAALLKEGGMHEYHAKFDENYTLYVAVDEKMISIFEGEKMADDMGVTKSATGRKDFLINKTEKGELTLDKFKTYFHLEPKSSFVIRKKKIKKPKKSKK